MRIKKVKLFVMSKTKFFNTNVDPILILIARPT